MSNTKIEEPYFNKSLLYITQTIMFGKQNLKSNSKFSIGLLEAKQLIILSKTSQAIQ